MSGALFFASIALLSPKRSSALEPVLEFGDNPGDLAMHVHRPAKIEAGLPLVVALQGCRQTAAAFDEETGLVALAEETSFVLLLPEQNSENNALGCFRWFDPDDNRPGRGESDDRRRDRSGGRRSNHIFVLGLSAGGAMTAVLLANYPDRFAGGAVIAGAPFDCSRPLDVFE